MSIIDDTENTIRYYGYEDIFVCDIDVSSVYGAYTYRFISNDKLNIDIIKGMSNSIEAVVRSIYIRNESHYLSSYVKYSTFLKKLIKDVNMEFRMYYNINRNILLCRDYNVDIPTININLDLLKKLVTLNYFMGYLRLKGFT